MSVGECGERSEPHGDEGDAGNAGRTYIWKVLCRYLGTGGTEYYVLFSCIIIYAVENRKHPTPKLPYFLLRIAYCFLPLASCFLPVALCLKLIAYC